VESAEGGGVKRSREKRGNMEALKSGREESSQPPAGIKERGAKGRGRKGSTVGLADRARSFTNGGLKKKKKG